MGIMGSDFHTPIFYNHTIFLSSCDVNLKCCPSKYGRVYGRNINFLNSNHKRTKAGVLIKNE